MIDKVFLEKIIGVATLSGLVLSLTYLWGRIDAQRLMAEELISLYLSSAVGTLARKEVHEAIHVIADEFNNFKAKSNSVWIMVRKAIKSFQIRSL